MQCELCNQENPITCDHPKNAYCALLIYIWIKSLEDIL